MKRKSLVVETQHGPIKLVYLKTNWLERIALRRKADQGRYDVLYAPHMPGCRQLGCQFIVRPTDRLRAAAGRTRPPGIGHALAVGRMNWVEIIGFTVSLAFTDPIHSILAFQPFLLASILLRRQVKKLGSDV